MEVELGSKIDLRFCTSMIFNEELNCNLRNDIFSKSNGTINHSL